MDPPCGRCWSWQESEEEEDDDDDDDGVDGTLPPSEEDEPTMPAEIEEEEEEPRDPAQGVHFADPVTVRPNERFRFLIDADVFDACREIIERNWQHLFHYDAPANELLDGYDEVRTSDEEPWCVEFKPRFGICSGHVQGEVDLMVRERVLHQDREVEFLLVRTPFHQDAFDHTGCWASFVYAAPMSRCPIFPVGCAPESIAVRAVAPHRSGQGLTPAFDARFFKGIRISYDDPVYENYTRRAPVLLGDDKEGVQPLRMPLGYANGPFVSVVDVEASALAFRRRKMPWSLIKRTAKYKSMLEALRLLHFAGQASCIATGKRVTTFGSLGASIAAFPSELTRQIMMEAGFFVEVGPNGKLAFDPWEDFPVYVPA